MDLPSLCPLVYTARMTIKALILLVLLSRTPHHRDTEGWNERKARLELVANAISDASLRATCQGPYTPREGEKCRRLWPASAKAIAFLLATQAIHETHLSAEIHHNRCRLQLGECDARIQRKGGKLVYTQQSFSLWQIKRYGIPDLEWAAIQDGVPGTRHAAWFATRRLASAYRSCGTLTGAVSRYARGSGCKWEGAAERVETWQHLISLSPEQLRAGVARQKSRLQTP